MGRTQKRGQKWDPKAGSLDPITGSLPVNPLPHSLLKGNGYPLGALILSFGILKRLTKQSEDETLDAVLDD